MSASGSGKGKNKNAPGQRLDPGWEHGIDVDSTSRKVKCKYCSVTRSGGIYRLKHHLACIHQNVEPCPQVPEELKKKFQSLLQTQSEESHKKRRKLYEIDEEEEEEIQQPMNKRMKGSMDKFVVKKSAHQTTLNEKFKKEERNRVCQTIARFFYTSAIPFNCANNPVFPLMIKEIGDYGKGLVSLSYHEIRETFLKKEVRETLNLLEGFKEQWKKTGCTIMSDGWSDKKRRSLCNFLVNSPSGTIFLSSLDTSEISKTGQKVFEMLDEVVEKVGEENVVQVVTDNASNYKLAGQMLMQKRKILFWTPCAAHCIDLILEDFEKHITMHRVTVAKARRVVSYIYARTLLNHWMKEYTKGKELIRPAITRFATSYLTLQRLNEQKGALMSLFSSNKWRSSKFASTNKGKRVADIVLDNRHFWSNVILCLKAATPLIKVLRLVDFDERPAMGFIYEAMDRAKEQIQKNFNNIQKSYDPIWKIIDERWESQLHQPLHAAAYYLNPQFHYSPNFHSDAEVKIGLYNCLKRMVPDVDERVKIDMQMDAFTDARGLFGLESAVVTRTKEAPALWWKSYGDECPELQRFAIRILSLTCSSSRCERNWSAFEMVHSKRRNRLHQKRLNDLVFVMYNLKLRERHMNRQAITDPICLDDFPSDDKWITEKEDPTLPTNGNWLEVLDRSAQHDIDEDDEVEVITRTLERASGGNIRPREVEEVHEVSDEDEPLNASRDIDDINEEEEFGEAIGANDVDDEDEVDTDGGGDDDADGVDHDLDENFGNDDDLF